MGFITTRSQCELICCHKQSRIEMTETVITSVCQPVQSTTRLTAQTLTSANWNWNRISQQEPPISPIPDKVYPFCWEEFQLRKQEETKTGGELAWPRSLHQESWRLAGSVRFKWCNLIDWWEFFLYKNIKKLCENLHGSISNGGVYCVNKLWIIF